MKSLFFLFAVVFFVSACTYQSKEDLGIGEEPCEILEVGYNVHILPIVDNRCVSCHQPGFEGGGIDLQGYDKVKQSVETGGFLGSVIHDSQWSAMPPNVDKIPECEIRLIEHWIAEGAQNN